MERIPNWLRYILAIPYGIVSYLIIYYIGYFSNLWIASPDSLMIRFYCYIYTNVIGTFIFMYAMISMLPKHQFKFAVVVSIILCALAFVGIGMSIMIGNVTYSDIIAIFLWVGSFIYSCYYIFKVFNSNSSIIDVNDYAIEVKDYALDDNENKYTKLFRIVAKGLNVCTVDEAILKTYTFYKEQGLEVENTPIDDDKYKTLANILMFGLGTNDMDKTISTLIDFYSEQGIDMSEFK